MIKNEKCLPFADEINGSRQITLFLLGFLGINVLSLLITFLLSVFVDIEAASDEMMIFYSSMANLTIYLLLVVFFAFIIKRDDLIRIFSPILQKKPWIYGVLGGSALLIGTAIISMILTLINPQLSSNDNENSVRAMMINQPVITFILTVILAPLVEELTYRMGVFANLRKNSRLGAYLLTIFIFAIIHANFTGDFINELFNLPMYFFSSFILCYTYEKSGYITSSMIAHAINNAAAFIFMMIGLGG